MRRTCATSASRRSPRPTRPELRRRLSQVALLPEDAPGQVDLFPRGQLDQDLQQIDLRGRNSWRLLLHEVSSVELLEVHLVNAIAPFIINARLKALMLRTPERDKHIVNVSAMEGQFYRNFKTTRHPHTNMAKAALNMMTRTSAADYQGCGIHMNSVDTGWVTDEDPAEIAARKTAEQRFHPPLDIVDGAARIVDPDHQRVQYRHARLGTVPEGLRADGLVKRVEEDFGCLRAGSPVAFVEYKERHASGADVTREIDVGLDGFRVPVVAQRRCGFVAIETCIGCELGELFRVEDRSLLREVGAEQPFHDRILQAMCVGKVH